jgi:hypothetical protein
LSLNAEAYYVKAFFRVIWSPSEKRTGFCSIASKAHTPAGRSGFCKMQITAFYGWRGGDSKNPQDVPNRLCAVTITCLMVKMSCDDSTCSDRPLSSSLPLAYALRERERKCERFQRLRQVKLGRFKKKTSSECPIKSLKIKN